MNWLHELSEAGKLRFAKEKREKIDGVVQTVTVYWVEE
jgi:hypothetical protein